MTKNDLVNLIHKSATDRGAVLTKAAAAAILEDLLTSFASTIRSEKKLALTGFGTFTVRNRKARKGLNPKTKESIDIAASKTVGFKPSAAFKSTL